MADRAYGDVIAGNAAAVRARRQLDLRNVEARMRKLGYGNWHRGIMGKIERGERRLLADELLALSYVLETSVEVLLTPAVDERGYIRLGEGAVHMQHAAARVRDVSDDAIRWDGDEPVFMTKVGGWGKEAEALGASPDVEDEPASGQEAG